ncbi:MAG: universal stress protein [Aureliella sp.]
MNILLPTDGSPESVAAAEYLTRLPLPVKPQVTLLAVISESESFDNTATLRRSVASPEEDERLTREHLDNVSKLLDEAGWQSTQLIKRGHPSRVIVDTSKEVGADLVAVGAVGHNSLYRIVLGSTADYVANHAECSVLVIRPDSARKLEKHGFRVMLAYDDSPAAHYASSEMFSLNWSQEYDHIRIAMMLGRPELLPSDVDYDREAIEQAEQDLEFATATKKCACKVSHTVRETLHIGSALLSLALDKQINLVFIGPTGKTALSRFFLGSTSRYLLNQLNCPVWISREKSNKETAPN